MGFNDLNQKIDQEQSRIDALDDTPDQSGESTPESVLGKMDAFQAKVEEAEVPLELKQKQLDQLRKILEKTNAETLEASDKALLESLTRFEQTLDQLEEDGLYEVVKGDTIGELVQDRTGIKFKEDPKQFFAAIRAIQDARDAHGSILKVNEDGSIQWEKGSTSPDLIEIGEFLDLSVLDHLTPKADDIDVYLAQTKHSKFKAGLERIKTTIRYEDAESDAVRDEVDDLIEDRDEEVPSPDQLDEDLESLLNEEVSDAASDAPIEGETVTTMEEYRELVKSMNTEEERRAFLENLSKDIQEGRDAIELDELQTARFEQIDLIRQMSLGMADEFSGDAKTLSMTVSRFFSSAETLKSAAAQAEGFKKFANEILPQVQQQIILDPTLKLEDVPAVKAFMDSIGKVQGGGLHAVNLKDLSTVDAKDRPKDLSRQKAESLQFLSDINHYEAIREVAEKELEPEFDKAREKISKERVAELRTEAEAHIQGMAAPMLAEWKTAGLTDAQIKEYTKGLIEEDHKHRLTEEALYYHFDATKDIPAAKAAVWEVYNETFDPTAEWFNMTEDHFDFVVQELLINAPLIVLSAGVGTAVRGALSARALLLLEKSPRLLALYKGTSLGSKAVRLTGAASGLLVEGAAFEITHNAVHATVARSIGIEEEYLWNSPDWMQKILMSSATLGLFHQAGRVGNALGRGLDNAVARRLTGNLAIGDAALKATLVENLAKEIADTTVRKVIQHCFISGSVEVGTMLLISAAQNGYTAGNLQAFMDNFEEELFHATVTVGALKTSGHLTGKAVGSFSTKPPEGPTDTTRSGEAPKPSRLREALKNARDILGGAMLVIGNVSAPHLEGERSTLTKGYENLLEFARTTHNLRRGTEKAEAEQIIAESKAEYKELWNKFLLLKDAAWVTNVKDRVSKIEAKAWTKAQWTRLMEAISKRRQDIRARIDAANPRPFTAIVDRLTQLYRYAEGKVKEMRAEKGPEGEKNAETILEVKEEISPLERQLYPNGLERAEIKQGDKGVCYLLTSLNALRKGHPELFRRMISENIKTTNDPNTLSVTIPGAERPGPYLVNIKGPDILDRGDPIRSIEAWRQVHKGEQAELGDIVLELAYASYKGTQAAGRRGLTMKARKDSAGEDVLAVEGGWGHRTLAELLSGRHVRTKFVNEAWSDVAGKSIMESGSDAVILALRNFAGNPDRFVMTANTKIGANGRHDGLQLLGPHAYTIRGYDMKTGEVHIEDPHDTVGKSKRIPLKLFLDNFAQLSYVELKATESPLGKYLRTKPTPDAIRSRIQSEGLEALCSLKPGENPEIAIRELIDAFPEAKQVLESFTTAALPRAA